MMRPDVTGPVCHTVSPAGSFVSPSETTRGVCHDRGQFWTPAGRFCPRSWNDLAGSADFVDPVEGVGEAAILDADQLVAQAHSDRARGAVADQPLGGGALDPADRGDHGGGAAG